MAKISVADLPPRYQAQVLQQLKKQRAREPGKGAKTSKYHNVKTEVNGIKFDSLKEARRFQTLLYYQERGYIKDLRLQQDFTLQEAYTTAEGQRIQAIRYRADFTYELAEFLGAWGEFNMEGTDWYYFQEIQAGRIIEDTKGVRTDVYKMKKKMMADRGYQIREI